MDLISKTRDLGYNIFDLNNSFYKDICSIFIYNNTDFSLSERKTLLDLSDENLTVPGCNYTSFDIKTIRTIYLCKIGNEINGNNSISEIIINDNNFFVKLKKQKYFSKYSTIEIIKCYSIILNSKLFTKNYGFYIMFFMNISNILLFIFSFSSKLEKQLNLFCNTILSQIKKLYNKKQTEINLKIDNVKNTENSYIVNDKKIDIDNNNISKNDNTNISDNHEIGIENKENSIDSSIKMKKDNSNILINNLGNINDDINKSNYNGDDERKIIEEEKKKII